METHERHIESGDAEERAATKTRVVEDDLVGRQSAEWPQVLLDSDYRAEVEVDKSQMVPSLKTQAAMEYKGYQALIDRAVDVFGDELTASRWLSMPTPDLDGATPLEVAEDLHYDPADLRKRFEPIFIRIEHGIDV